jgi:LuxR family maltose regulon positive regulatory protein
MTGSGHISYFTHLAASGTARYRYIILVPMENVLSIKLHQPAPPLKRVPRPALIQRLNDGLAYGRQLTLVSAPAGFGKTACICDWLAGVSLPATWLSLDAADNDPQRFLTYLAAALKKAGDMPGFETVLQAGQLAPVEAISTALINDILNLPSSLLLILDDLHVIQDRFIYQILEKLILTPLQPLHLVMLTREDPALPLARLRANNQLTEIRAADLRFSSDETRRFLNEVMSLRLSAADIALLEERTEGWVAGLQLAGLSIRDRPNPSVFISSLSGSHRHILSYLTEEVLSRQPQEIQDFLLNTSILDRLSGDLCSAVTGRADSPLLLEQLCGANLFLTPLDDEQRWYRYHHLFADLLRHRQKALHAEETAELHRRASRWYALACEDGSFGERSTFAGEAIRHALAAEEFAEAARLIESHALEMLRQWHLKTVGDWIRALPPEWSTHSPRTILAFARMHMAFGDLEQAAPYLAQLEKLFSDSQDSDLVTPSLKAEWLSLQSTVLGMQGRASESLELAQQALAIAPDADDSARSQIYSGLAMAYQGTGDIPRAIDAFLKIIQLGRATSDLVTELMGIAPLVLLLIGRGQLRYGYELAMQGIERVERAGMVPPIIASIYGELGQICFQWGRWEEAREYSRRAAESSVLSGFSDAIIFHTVTCASLLLVQGDIDAAAAQMKLAVEQMRVDAPIVVRESVIAQQVCILLAQNDLSAAEAALGGLAGSAALPDLVPGQGVQFSQGPLYTSALRIHLHRARVLQGNAAAQSLSDGVRLADCLVDPVVQSENPLLAVEAFLLRAQLHAAAGDPQSSLADVSAALDLAEPEGCVSDFIAAGPFAARALTDLLRRCAPGSLRENTIQKILKAYTATRGEVTAAAPAPVRARASIEPAEQVELNVLVEPLTDRELDVLGCVAEGLKYEEIASRLVISVNTVRSHVKAIYGKLGVNNRTAAIEAARKQNMLKSS